jgi:hypothetical protein
MENNKKPVHSFRYGNVNVAIWADSTHEGYFLNTTIQRCYLVNGVWGESNSFDDRDLPNLAKAAADAHSWIHQQKAQADAAASVTSDA